MAAILYFQTFTSQPFEELQESNLDFKLINPKLITQTSFDANMSRIYLAALQWVLSAYFDTRFSVIGLAPFATEGGAEGSIKVLKGPSPLQELEGGTPSAKNY